VADPSEHFSRVTGLAKGYQTEQVDEFFLRALSGQVSSAEVRAVGFDLVRAGYEVRHVDEALDRLEDETGRRERDSDQTRLGSRGFYDLVTSHARILRQRLDRPHGDRFPRAAALTAGYDVQAVDELCDQLAEYFDGQLAMAPDQVRTISFRGRRGARGYAESSVDRFLDQVVEIMTQVS
jgi:DivIVA domain-containing protein